MGREEGERSSRHRRLPRSPAVPSPLDDDDMLSEILLLLPPLPSSLPRASVVCKRWRSLVTDPRFLRRFRLRHRRNPPLLGFFHRGDHGISFFPTLEAPDRVPPGRFSLQLDDNFLFLGCRHGLVLIFDEEPLQFLVWDPITGQKHHLDIPSGFDPTMATVNGAVLRSASAAGDLQQFKVVLVVADNDGKLNRQLLACVYSSETGVWGNPISAPSPSQSTTVSMRPSVLVGDSLYWPLLDSSLNYLEFDLARESLTMMWTPAYGLTVMRAEGGVLGLLSLSGFTVQLWKRRISSDGVASWGAGITVELDKLLSLNSNDFFRIQGFAEENNLLFLWTRASLFTVEVESLQFKKLSKPEMLHRYHPFESVYAAGI